MTKYLAALIVAAPLLVAGDGSMTADERSYLVDQLETSKTNFLASFDGLSDAQWKFKPAPTVWSVQECAEHIVLAEGFIFGNVQNILKTPVVPRPEKSNANVDHMLVAGVQDRSHKVTAPEPITPAGKFATPADAAKAFIAARDKTIAWAKTSDDELRVHVGPGPAGPMDAYQFMLLLASHSARHTAQIKEVESNPDFPKSSGK